MARFPAAERTSPHLRLCGHLPDPDIDLLDFIDVADGFYRYEPGEWRLLRISGSKVFLDVIRLHPDRPILPIEMFEDRLT